MTKVEFRHVSFTYSDNPHPILNDVSLTLHSGERVAIIGQNGTGKTTLIKQINGLLTPTQGNIFIDDVPVADRPTFEWAKQVGYVFQNPNDQLFLDSVKKELLFGVKHIRLNDIETEDRLANIAHLTGLTEFMEAHPLDLSNVQKKFCAIGSVLMMHPNVVVLDEPTGGQDYQGMKRLSELLIRLKHRDRICVAVSHDMKFVARNFDRVVVMTHGEVALDGTPAEVFTDSEALKAAAITPPPLMALAQSLGWSQPVLTQSAFIKEFKRHLK